MKILLKISFFVAVLLVVFTSALAQSHIDNNYKFGTGSGTYLLKGAGNTDNDYISFSVGNDKVSASGRIRRMNGTRLQGNFNGKIENNGIIHGTVNWSVAPADIKNAGYFQLYKRSGSNELVMAFYENTSYKTNSRARPKLTLSANSIKKGSGTSNNTTASNTSTTSSNHKVKVRVDYKFIFLGSSIYWNKSILNDFAASFAANIFGTGSVRAYSETSSGSKEIKALNNANARVFDIPKSKAVTKYSRHFFDSKKNRSWGGSEYGKFGFYSFAKDAELKKGFDGHREHSDNALFVTNRRIEFEVNRAALEGRTERVGINVQAHLSSRAPGKDIVFGNIHRKVYLHELTNQSKLSNNEKLFNRKLEGAGHNNQAALAGTPYYFFAGKDNYNDVYVAFTVEIID